MRQSSTSSLERIYPRCIALVDNTIWAAIVAGYEAEKDIHSLDEVLASRVSELGLPEFLPGLARLEHTIAITTDRSGEVPRTTDRRQINPTLTLIESTWSGLTQLIDSANNTPIDPPAQTSEIILIWYHPKHKEVKCRPATDEDLLALKIVAEDIDPRDVAREGAVPTIAIENALYDAIKQGLILDPPSLIRRDQHNTEAWRTADEQFLQSSFFTIQWHITQACDLHCRHCYDRSKRSPLTLEQGIGVLDDLLTFCRNHHVRGQVSFTGGNPFLYPHFFELYRAAAERGFLTAILGNPVSRNQLEQIVAIQMPVHYQVSLEGLEQHNDYIRGKGNFENVMAFLPILRDLEISSQVMLTLTKDNIGQVLPLAELLRNRVNSFTFNRLSQVGEGVRLAIPDRDEYREFLGQYIEAATLNPVMSLKDNLINIIRYQKGEALFGGCAGYGCSAAFNFIAILPDGEAHACRKFPSRIGNVCSESIETIYDSDAARRYRAGTTSCHSCSIRPVCGGCLAVMYGQGLNIFEARDPHCFM